MILKRKLGPKGQIVIPKDIRDMLNIKPGSEIIFEIHENKITIRSAKNGKDFLKNFIKTPKKLKEPIDYKEVLDQQYRSK
jgi:AbrB family looped-hinge helix DNA binding protein